MIMLFHFQGISRDTFMHFETTVFQTDGQNCYSNIALCSVYP